MVDKEGDEYRFVDEPAYREEKKGEKRSTASMVKSLG
jgi:hypothetical protein